MIIGSNNSIDFFIDSCILKKNINSYFLLHA